MNSPSPGLSPFISIQERPVPSGPWITGMVGAPVGKVAQVGTRLSFRDTLDCWKAKWGIGRMKLLVVPGLYAVGTPGRDSRVFVTANYKPSFDALRAELDCMDAWILVLDTKGVNVWCAAGKGTFGTDELVRRISMVRLKDVVSHRTVILPQLGAPGVSGHLVKAASGFRVIFGPVRAKDLKAFMDNNLEATPAMRSVTFNVMDRLAVVPIELVQAVKYFLYLVPAVIVWKAITGTLSVTGLLSALIPVFGAMLTGVAGVPMLLPWIPVRSFALKGWVLGMIWTLAAGLLLQWGTLEFIGNLLLLPAVSAYLSLNYTGCTTFTSQTGVNREISWFARPMGIAGLAGFLLIGVGVLMRVLL